MATARRGSRTRGRVRRISDIVDLRLLPPMGIARFGSSPEPMDNYRLEDPPLSDPAGFRQIVPAETLIVGDDGAITEIRFPDERVRIARDGTTTSETTRPVVSFRDSNHRIKPVCPFFEVWAQFTKDGEFRPLTLGHLSALGLDPGAVRWRVTAANRKAVRRTGQLEDLVEASTKWVSDHEQHELIGRCRNFKAGKSISFGRVRYVKPMMCANVRVQDITSVIRARFTPGKGLVFGPRRGDPLTHDDVYWARTDGGRPTARWDRYYVGAGDDEDEDSKVPTTAPGDIFQGAMMGLSKDDEQWGKLSSGYFDDTCDGIIEVRLRHKGRELSAYARFACAVPDFAPDSLPARSIADDLAQLALGPVVDFDPSDRQNPEFQRLLIDTLRRALETVRQMNTVAANGTSPYGGVENWQNMSKRLAYSWEVPFEPVFPTVPGVDVQSVRQMYSFVHAVARHKQQLKSAARGERVAAYYVMRLPEEAGDLWPTSRMRMPAFMRGSEGLELCLTLRQLSLLAVAAGEKSDVMLAGRRRSAVVGRRHPQ